MQQETTTPQMNTSSNIEKNKTTKKTTSKKSKSKKVTSVSQPVSEPVSEPVSQPVSEPVSQPVSEPVSEPVQQTQTNSGKQQKLKKPKRALTAYNCYSKEQYPIIKSSNASMNFGEVQKLVSTQWKKMSDTDKTPYLALHEADKTRYSSELETYNAAPDELKVMPKKKKVKYTGPKRPLSAYMFFKQNTSEEIKKSNPSISFGDLQKEVGIKWTDLKASTKKEDIKRLAKYHKQHNDDKTRYEKELVKYNEEQNKA